MLLGGCGDSAASTAEPSGPMVLDYNFGADPATLDPVLASDPAALAVIPQLFEGLTRYDSQQAGAVPALATDWDVSGDGLTYTFKLRAGTLWVNQEGEPVQEVTASDVVYALKRACNPATLAPNKGVLFIIKGCREVHESVGVPDLDRVAVRALEPLVVEFTLNAPAAYFPVILSLPVAWPVPEGLVGGVGELWSEPGHLLTNGPYLVDAWQRGSRLTLTRNPRYPAPVPIERVNGVMLPPDEALERFLAGELDTVQLEPEQIERMGEEGAALWTQAPEPCTYGYGFTMVKPPVDNARVRRALSLALDRRWLVDNVLGGAPIPAHHLAPPGVAGALPASTLGVQSNVQVAQGLLAEAGYPGGQGFPTLTLLHPEDEQQARLAAATAETWQMHLGVEVTVQALPLDEYLATIQPTTPVEEMAHLWALGWCAPFPDEHGWLHALFNVANPPDGAALPAPEEGGVTVQAGSNHVRRTPNRLDELTDQAAATTDPETRQALYAEAEQLLVVEEAALIPLYHPAENLLTQPWLQRIPASLSAPFFQAWTIDVAAKETARSGEPVE